MEGQSKSFKDSPFFSKTAFGQTKRQLARRLYAVLSVPAFNRLFAAQKNKLDMFTVLQSGK